VKPLNILKISLLSGIAWAALQPLQAQTAATQTAPANVASGAASASPPSAPDQAADQGREIVVTGFRQSYLNAVNMKRADVGISDSISSDGLGRFPDLNVGEALQRIPGVQINREAGSRDATINLRGLPGSYARYTINGQSYADPVLDSSTPLGAFNADIFSAITVRKTISPTDQAGGLSGIIDLQIAPALSRKDGGFFKIAGEYDTLGKYKTPQGTIGYTKHITPDLAVFGVASFKQEKFRRDQIFFNAYSPLSPTTTPGFSAYQDYYSPFNGNGSCPSGKVCAATGTGAKGTTGVLYASDQRQATNYNSGTLFTAAGGAEWRPTSDLKVGVTGFFTRRNLSKNLTDLFELDMRSNRAVISPTTSPVLQGDGNAYVQGFNYSNIQLNDSVRSQPLLEQAWDIIGSAEWKSEDWRFSGTLTDSRGENNQLQTQIDVRNLPTAAGNGANGAFNSGGGDISQYLLTLNRNPALTVPSGPFTWAAGNQPTQIAANGDQIIVAGSSGYGLNKVKAAQGELERELRLPVLSAITFGGRYEQDKYISRGYRTSAKGIQTQNIDSKFLTSNPYVDSFFGGTAGNYLSNWPQLDYDYIVSRLQPVTAAAGDVVTPTGWINDPTNSSYSLFNFNVRKNIFALYGQADLAFEFAGIQFKGYAGLHYENTDQLIDALAKQVDPSGAVVFGRQQFHSKYHQWLPSVYLSADVAQNMVLRTAYYRAFVRPQPRSLTPSTGVSANSTGYSIQYGGADLKPYYADSEDVSLEWYNRPGGLFSIAGYRKVIHNLIAPETRLSMLCPADATQFGLGHLHTVGTTCYSDILVAGQPAIITASGSYNQTNPIKVLGLEFTAQQNLDFLPGILKYLGGQFNYSYTKISGRNPDGTKAQLPGVSKNNINLIGYFESPRLGARLIYTWRDQYTLTGGNSFTGGSSFVAPRAQVDGSISFKFNERYSLSLDAFNLTDAKRYQYQVVEGIPRQVDYDGRTFTLSFHGTF
jgi:TonB-dependent receptor